MRANVIFFYNAEKVLCAQCESVMTLKLANMSYVFVILIISIEHNSHNLFSIAILQILFRTVGLRLTPAVAVGKSGIRATGRFHVWTERR